MKAGKRNGKATRSELMARIRSKDTMPEMVVRRLLFTMGYRYHIHQKNLPGCPDIVFMRRRKAIFVNGCFWHQHQGCPRASVPATNLSYWLPKLERNRQRDEIAVRDLNMLKWDVLTIWECEAKQPTSELRKRLKRFLGPLRAPLQRNRAMRRDLRT